MVTATVCQHRWQLPAEPESRDERVVRRGATIIQYRSTFVGTCKNCGEERSFTGQDHNAYEDRLVALGLAPEEDHLSLMAQVLGREGWSHMKRRPR